MNVTKAVKIWIDYHRAHLKKKYSSSLPVHCISTCLHFKDFEVDQISTDEVLAFLNELTEASKPYTKRIRYSQLSSFFNFVKNNIESDCPNPCDVSLIRKLFRQRVVFKFDTLEK